MTSVGNKTCIGCKTTNTKTVATIKIIDIMISSYTLYIVDIMDEFTIWRLTIYILKYLEIVFLMAYTWYLDACRHDTCNFLHKIPTKNANHFTTTWSLSTVSLPKKVFMPIGNVKFFRQIHFAILSTPLIHL